MERMAERLELVKKCKVKAGKNDLIKHLSGKRLTRNQAIKAKCYDCNGYGESDECSIITCPLYPFSPYRQKSTDATFMRTERTKQPKSKASEAV